MRDIVPSPIAFLPVDLHRWDRSPGGDVLVVPIWSDIRPLRGPAGLLDWRLCGKISQMIREGRVSGAAGEKLLVVTGRVPWRRVLAIGVGSSDSFDAATCRMTLDRTLDATHGIGAQSLAIALPGRDVDLVKPDVAMACLREAVESSHESQGQWLRDLTVIDVPPATKTMGDMSRSASSSQKLSAD